MSKFSPLSNFDIDEHLNKFDYYNGTFSKNNLPAKIGTKEMGIINLDDFGNPGTHWVAYFNAPGHKYVYYFDSFGLPPPEEVKRYLKTSHKQIQMNTGEIQQIDSIMCGYYCVYVLEQLDKGSSFYDAIYSFDPYPSEYNETKIKSVQNI